MDAILFTIVTILIAFLLMMLLGLLRIVWSIPGQRWREASELSGSSVDVFYGEVEADRDGLRDPRVAKGKVWDNATSQWLPQGKLSDEYLNGLVR